MSPPPAAIQSIGFIGLGLMGKPMARNLMKAGFKLTVKSRRPGPAEELAAEGATAAATPREAAEASDLVVTMLPDSPEVREVCLGPDGVIHAARRPLTVADMSTISPKASREIGEALAAKGIGYLEAPVSGGDAGAIKGTLAIMAGGPRETFDLVQPAFAAMGKAWTLMGDWGAGQTTKLANNIIAAITIESVGEAAVFASKAGVDIELMLKAIGSGAAACWSLDAKIPKIAAGDFKPGFMVKLHLKDLNLALEAGRGMGVPLPLTEKVRDMLQELNDAGMGNDDNCSLVRILERLAGHEARRRSAA